MASSNVDTFRTVHDLFNSRGFDELLAKVTDDFRYVDHPRQLTFDKQEFRDVFLAGWIRAFSDAQVTDREYIDAGDTVVCRFVGRGTNDGQIDAAPPTGRTMALDFCEIARFDREGRVTAAEAYYDQATILSQLGLMPAGVAT